MATRRKAYCDLVVLMCHGFYSSGLQKIFKCSYLTKQHQMHFLVIVVLLIHHGVKICMLHYCRFPGKTIITFTKVFMQAKWAEVRLSCMAQPLILSFIN